LPCAARTGSLAYLSGAAAQAELALVGLDGRVKILDFAWFLASAGGTRFLAAMGGKIRYRKCVAARRDGVDDILCDVGIVKRARSAGRLAACRKRSMRLAISMTCGCRTSRRARRC
jgi:hypothetical protein